MFKDGFKKQFKTEKGYQYEIAVEEGETYINCMDEFDKIFGFSQNVLKDNKLMDILSPEEFDSHKTIVSNMYSVYKEFSDEYLRNEYNPDVKAFKYAIETHNLKPDIFDKEEHLLTNKDKLRRQLFMKAYNEIENTKKEAEKTFNNSEL